MTVSAIVAMSRNQVIGKNNDLPWHLPAELKFFKETTDGHPVIMGRNTFESIYERLGKPLPNRTNIVISSSMKSAPKGFILKNNLSDAIDMATNVDDKVFIIGGAKVYSSALEKNIIDTIYLTVIDTKIEGDTFFPKLQDNEWSIETLFEHKSDDNHKYGFIVYKYSKVSK